MMPSNDHSTVVVHFHVSPGLTRPFPFGAFVLLRALSVGVCVGICSVYGTVNTHQRLNLQCGLNCQQQGATLRDSGCPHPSPMVYDDKSYDLGFNSTRHSKSFAILPVGQ